MKRIVAALLFFVTAVILPGCQHKSQFGDKKEDWAKTPPPPQWRGPGQPGGPPTGAASGPLTPVGGGQAAAPGTGQPQGK